VIESLSREVYIPVAILLLGFVLIVSSAWRSVKHQIQLYPAHSHQWRRWYAFFIAFVTIGTVFLLVLVTKVGSKIFSHELGFAPIAILVLLLTVPMFVATLYLETSARRFLTRRFMVIFVASALPFLTYFSLVGTVDEVAVAVLLLITAIVSIVLLVWDLHKQRKETPL